MRQYFQGGEFSAYDVWYMRVAHSLDTRPSRTLGWKAPAEAYAEIVRCRVEAAGFYEVMRNMD